ncbi:MAG: tRNA (adenosine(37)-N6)-threonylcarbamoyltransferase complex ATPase subunit type 1 TsaE [Tepidisphaeraceae bacterium]|jgi:tRNA threonylcarbamoyladenosine biosynthesis protein TsaE
MKYRSRNIAQTESIAAKLAGSLEDRRCVALYGELGAGKTQFVRGLVAGLGGNPRAVSSPTFVLLNVYTAGTTTVHHLDAYRVAGSRDFEQIGFSELLEQDGVIVIEWAEKVADLLPPRRIDVRIEIISASQRQITIERIG